MLSESKKLTLRWLGWFGLANVVVFCLASMKLLSAILWSSTRYPILVYGTKLFASGVFYITYLGFFAVLAYLPCVILIPIALIFKNRNWIFLTYILCSIVTALYLALDSIVYCLYHFHVGWHILTMIWGAHGKQFFTLSTREYHLIYYAIAGVFIVEFVLAHWVWQKIILKKRYLNLGKYIAGMLGLCSYIAFAAVYLTSNVVIQHVLIGAARALPLYENIHRLVFLKSINAPLFDPLLEDDLYQFEYRTKPITYPMHAMQCVAPKKTKNVVMIVIDSWRFDMLNKSVTPNISQFAETASVFTEHRSGGNCTGPGVFSLFYGLPAYYWSAMDDQQKQPVFMQELLRDQYQINVLASASLQYPAFIKNVFLHIPDVGPAAEGKTPFERDQTITKKFQQFIAGRDMNKPFFSFLFYDSAHAYCEIDNALKPLQPTIKECQRETLTNASDPVPYLNRYKNAVMLVDNQIKQVLQTLQKKHLLDNTIVIITGDHGQEFNDTHLGYWDHGSDFTKYQVNTPLVVYWPGKKPAKYHFVTTHYDVVPTLMTKVLGCQSPTMDYSFGSDLFSKHDKSYEIVNSYLQLGVVDKHSIISLSQSGHIEVQDINGNVLDNVATGKAAIKQALQQLNMYS